MLCFSNIIYNSQAFHSWMSLRKCKRKHRRASLKWCYPHSFRKWRPHQYFTSQGTAKLGSMMGGKKWKKEKRKNLLYSFIYEIGQDQQNIAFILCWITQQKEDPCGFRYMYEITHAHITNSFQCLVPGHFWTKPHLIASLTPAPCWRS